MSAKAGTALPPRPRGLTLGRHQIGAFVATIVDFSVMIACVRLAGIAPAVATAAGAACGAVTNFLLGRRWIFHAQAGRADVQAGRYAVVALASLVLNTAGEHFVHDRLGVQYVVARVIVAFTVSICWNFPMHRAFVFRAEESR